MALGGIAVAAVAVIAKRADKIIERSVERAVKSRQIPLGDGLVATYATMNGKPPPIRGGTRRSGTL